MTTLPAAGDPRPATISVIIPTLNEAAAIKATLAAVARVGGRVEVIVADGGSTDGTPDLARAAGAQVLVAERGRGPQLHAGACAARGEILWFVHADTRPPEGAAELILEALRESGVIGGHFALRFEGTGRPTRAARLLTWLYPHLRWLGLCYGDSALFVRRDEYERAGGFRPFPLFEDLDLLRRLRRRGRLARLPAAVVTSARRFEGRSFALTFAGWTALQLLYWLGAPPRLLGRLYAPIRGAPRRGTSVASRSLTGNCSRGPGEEVRYATR